MTIVRAAVIQAHANMSKDEAVDKHVELIGKAAADGAQVTCLQEIFHGPYFCAEQDPKWYDTAEPDDGPIVQRMQQVAKQHGMVLVIPFYEKADVGVYYNTAVVIEKDGTVVGKYRKTHIPQVGPCFWEKFYFKPGNLGYPTFETSVGRLGLIICYDRHFPEIARALGLKGAQLVFNPSATVESLSKYLWELEQPAHAVANGYWIAAINRVGVEEPLNSAKFYGSSYFCDPRGQIQAKASVDDDEVLVHDVDYDVNAKVRNTWQFLRIARPELYGDLTEIARVSPVVDGVDYPDDAADLLERHRKVIPSWIALYYDEPIELVKGEGTKVWDSSGKEYLDFFGGIVTTISGHAVEALVEALREQAGKITHTSTLYLIRPMIELAEKLTGSAPIDGDTKAFFVGSGTEAVEAALLFATTYRRSNQIIALRNSYHGRGFGAMGVTGNRGWSASSLTPVNVSYAMPAYCYRCPLHLTYPSCGVACAQDVRNVIETTTSGDVAAMIAEPIQGVGGFVTPPPEYFSIVKGILNEFEIPFIADEVQTGFGRTGDTYWGIEGYGVEPDAMVMAKGLGNGMAMGAVVGRTEIVDSIKANSISTFGGNPLSTVTALANLQNIEDNDLQTNAQRVGKMLKDGLRDIGERYDIVGDVRGKGLMLGIEMVRDQETKEPGPDLAGRVLEGAKDRGLLIGKGGLYGNVIRLSPPLVITEEEAARAVETIEAAVADARI